MKKEIKLSDAIGKTLEGFAFSWCSEQAVMTFTDGTFATLGISKGWHDVEDEIKEAALVLFDFGHDKLFELGIISEDEMNEKLEQEKKMFAARQERREREIYERLKQKFMAEERK